MDDVRRSANRLRDSVTAAIRDAERHRGGASAGSRIDVAGRSNIVRNVNVGSPGSTHAASATQQSPIRQRAGDPARTPASATDPSARDQAIGDFAPADDAGQ